MKSDKYSGIEKYIFADIYLFFLKYKDIPNEDYYWECLLKDASIIQFKWKKHKLATRMLIDIVGQLEHIITGKELDGLTRNEWEETLKIAKDEKPFNSSNPFNNGK